LRWATNCNFATQINRRNIANGEFAAVTAIGAGEATIRFQGKQNRELTLPLSAMRHVDYGYTVTSFSSQGSTVDRVIVNDERGWRPGRHPSPDSRQLTLDKLWPRF